MTTKHTPGPWSIEYGVDSSLCVSDTSGRLLAKCCLECEDGDEDEANARLMAAAPDLLAAIKELLPMWQSGIEEPHVSAARAAIAKAIGAPRP